MLLTNRSRSRTPFTPFGARAAIINTLTIIFKAAFSLCFLSKKKEDGYYHFNYYENKFFKPVKKNHFDGHLYVLTGGNTFSAATLFAKTVRDQENVTVVGEETGGGAYGNTAWLIPEVVLPRTKVRFRLPLFRLVIDKNEKKGRGVMPQVEVLPNTEDIRRNVDFKMRKVMELIKEKQNALPPSHSMTGHVSAQ